MYQKQIVLKAELLPSCYQVLGNKIKYYTLYHASNDIQIYHSSQSPILLVVNLVTRKIKSLLLLTFIFEFLTLEKVKLLILLTFIFSNYSHSIVPGGFEVISYVTLLIPLTLLIIAVAVSLKKSCVNG